MNGSRIILEKKNVKNVQTDGIDDGMKLRIEKTQFCTENFSNSKLPCFMYKSAVTPSSHT